ncbi:replicative DNA helicase [Clostridia bacterium]|nr:replicative DNA helicase [Clostridia bacterium]
MEELTPRILPHSTEAEQSVIGAMLIDPKCVPDMITALKPDDFYLQQNRDIFETLYLMFGTGQTIDLVTLLARMRERGVYVEGVSRQYALQILDITPTSANASEYSAIVRDHSLRRKVAEAAREIISLAGSGSGEAYALLDAAEQLIYSIRQGRSDQNLVHIRTVLTEVYDRLDELAKHPGQLPGLTSGMPELDQVILGLKKSDLILIASRPGMGKTSFALNIALHASRASNNTVVFFSLEMPREQLATRLLSSEAMVDSKKLMTGDLNDAQWSKLAMASNVLSRVDLRIDDNPSINVNEMKAKCRRVENLGLIVIDYLQLMRGSKNYDNRVQEVGEISRSLKIMAKELNVPVLCLSQLSRANEARQDKRPMLSDLRESGAIEQDADIVMFLYRDDYYNKESEYKNLAECIVAKNRHGETGKIELNWIGEYTSFSSREWKHDDPQSS